MVATKLEEIFSKYIMEISKATDEYGVYKTFQTTVEKFLEFEKINVFKGDSLTFSYPETDVIDRELYQAFIPFIEERLSPAFIPCEIDGNERYIGLIPMVKQGKILGMIVIQTNREVSEEKTDLLQIFTYLAGITLENLKLFEFVSRSKEYFENIIESSSDGIIVLDGLGNTEFKNRVATQFIENLKELETSVKEMIEIQQFFREVSFSEQYYVITLKEVYMLNEKKYLVNIRNVTSEKEIQKLKELEKIKANFIANLSHELRTPLSAIKAYTETMITLDLSKEELNEFIPIIYEQSNRLEDLINDLFDYARLESGELTLKRENLKLNETVSKVVSKLSAEAEKNKVNLEIQVPDIEIYGDSYGFEKLFFHLLKNAIIYYDKDKEERYAKLTVSVDNDILKISVEDNGIGIPEDKFEKIFEKFYRIDNELTYTVSGTGLGLAIVKEIVEEYKGKIEVSSKVKEFTRFTIQIPLSSLSR